MGRRCTVCNSEHRAAVDIGLTHRTPCHVLATRYAPLGQEAIKRHARNCLSPAVRAAILTNQAPSAVDLAALQEREGWGLLSQLITQRARLEQHSQLAASLGNLAAAISAERSITENLRLVAQLLGSLIQRHEHTTKHSIFVSADYLEIREALLDVLKAHPEARATLSQALSRLETKEAQRIIDSAKPRALTIEHQPTAETTP